MKVYKRPQQVMVLDRGFQTLVCLKLLKGLLKHKLMSPTPEVLVG